MRVNVVSDVHDAAEPLARAGDGADLVVCLGDLLAYLDYADPSRGIYADLFGAEAASRYIALRTAGRFDEARAHSHALWQSLDEDPAHALMRQVHLQYARLFGALPVPALLTYGNVDVPTVWADHLREGQTVLDGATVDLDGLRFGFVGGGLRTPYRTPFERSDDEFADAVARLGPVDVLCTHIPPDVPQICYDVLARRPERGSAALLDYVREHQPRWHLHGHVHNPLVGRVRVGRTEVVNVGHFRGTGQPFRLFW